MSKGYTIDEYKSALAVLSKCYVYLDDGRPRDEAQQVLTPEEQRKLAKMRKNKGKLGWFGKTVLFIIAAVITISVFGFAGAALIGAIGAISALFLLF